MEALETAEAIVRAEIAHLEGVGTPEARYQLALLRYEASWSGKVTAAERIHYGLAAGTSMPALKALTARITALGAEVRIKIGFLQRWRDGVVGPKLSLVVYTEKGPLLVVA